MVKFKLKRNTINSKHKHAALEQMCSQNALWSVCWLRAASDDALNDVPLLFTCPFLQSFIHLFNHSSVCSLTHSFIQSCICSFRRNVSSNKVRYRIALCVRSCFGSQHTLILYMQELDMELQQERQKAKEAEALNRKPQACSHCGELGHNRRGCPELARDQQQEEEKKRQEQLGPLWGLAGVEEQRMPGGRQGVLVFPVPFQIEDAVDQVSVSTSCVMILTSSSSCS